MLKIIKDKAKNCPCDESLFISFNYNQNIIDVLKSMPIKNYDSATRQWEIPFEHKEILKRKTKQFKIDYYETPKAAERKPEYEYEFKTKPYQHQLDFLDYSLLKERVLVGDEMGLGKTKQALDLASIRLKYNAIKKILIICGVNALKSNWLKEIETHTNHKGWILGQRVNRKGIYNVKSNKEKLEDVRTLCGDYKFLITNIETLRNEDIALELENKCLNDEIDMIIFDEAHCCKNHAAKQTKGFLTLLPKYRVAMSGTFMLNSPLDLFVPLKWLNVYKDSFHRYQMQFTNCGQGAKNLIMLQKLVSANMIRRRKEEVIDLPEKVYNNIYVDLDKKQRDIYEDVLASIKAEIDLIKLLPNPMVKLLRARQATGEPSLITTQCNESAKMDRLVQLVDEITRNGNKCIVFSNWAQMIDVAVERLKEFNAVKVTGTIHENQVNANITKFKEEKDCSVICGTVGKMGTGLTLTEANYVIFLDSPWTMGAKEQAADRVHRIGQKNNVTILTLVAKDTLDERIEQLINRKGMLADMLIDGEMQKESALKALDFLLE